MSKLSCIENSVMVCTCRTDWLLDGEMPVHLPMTKEIREVFVFLSKRIGKATFLPPPLHQKALIGMCYKSEVS